MVKSMTGFGRASREIDGYMITVELKSVNHRYFEFSCRCPRQYGFIDDKIKSFVNSKVARGKIECYVGIEALNTESADVVVNNTLANAYVKALKEISTNYDLKEDFGASTIARFPDVLIVRKSEEDEEKIWQLVKTVANEAVEKFIDMRKVEGKKMFLLLRNAHRKPLKNIMINWLKEFTIYLVMLLLMRAEYYRKLQFMQIKWQLLKKP